MHIILQMLDWATTLFLVMTLGTDLEANPIVRFMIEQPYGMWWFTAIKFSMMGILAWMIPYSMDRSPQYGWVWRVVALTYLVVVLSNLVGVATVCMLS